MKHNHDARGKIQTLINNNTTILSKQVIIMTVHLVITGCGGVKKHE